MKKLILVLALLSAVVLAVGASQAAAEEFPELVPEGVELGDSFESIQCGADPRTARPNTCYGELIRCKTQFFSARWSQTRLFTALTYSGKFKVCYVHGSRIVSVIFRLGDASQVQAPWEWRGNDSGYPNHIRSTHWVEFNFRGSVQFCITQIGCGPQKHPWVRLTFFDNNTMDRDTGVVG